MVAALVRYQFPMTCDNENVAKCFALRLPGCCWTQATGILQLPPDETRNGV